MPTLFQDLLHRRPLGTLPLIYIPYGGGYGEARAVGDGAFTGLARRHAGRGRVTRG